MLRHRQAEEEKNDFDYLEEDPDDKGCESEDPMDDEPGSPEPVSNTKSTLNMHFNVIIQFSFEEVVTTKRNRDLVRRVPPQPYVAGTPKPVRFCLTYLSFLNCELTLMIDPTEKPKPHPSCWAYSTHSCASLL